VPFRRASCSNSCCRQSLRSLGKPRLYSTVPPAAAKSQTRLSRLIYRLPPSLQRYTRALENAPVQHVASFLILHEISAIVPLLALFGVFEWVGMGRLGEYVRNNHHTKEGLARFERYFKRKNWFGFRNESLGIDAAGVEAGVAQSPKLTERSSRILLEVATAYAITKLLLAPRLAFSVWATPWFAKTVLGPCYRFFGRGLR